jgi:tetratricopeptide (TPR) repeat protein
MNLLNSFTLTTFLAIFFMSTPQAQGSNLLDQIDLDRINLYQQETAKLPFIFNANIDFFNKFTNKGDSNKFFKIRGQLQGCLLHKNKKCSRKYIKLMESHFAQYMFFKYFYHYQFENSFLKIQDASTSKKLELLKYIIEMQHSLSAKFKSSTKYLVNSPSLFAYIYYNKAMRLKKNGYLKKAYGSFLYFLYQIEAHPEIFSRDMLHTAIKNLSEIKHKLGDYKQAIAIIKWIDYYSLKQNSSRNIQNIVRKCSWKDLVADKCNFSSEKRNFKQLDSPQNKLYQSALLAFTRDSSKSVAYFQAYLKKYPNNYFNDNIINFLKWLKANPVKN